MKIDDNIDANLVSSSRAQLTEISVLNPGTAIGGILYGGMNYSTCFIVYCGMMAEYIIRNSSIFSIGHTDLHQDSLLENLYLQE